jgi:hypothetical protein
MVSPEAKSKEASLGTASSPSSLSRPAGALYRCLAWKKHAAAATVAVARKLVVRLYTMLRDEIDYDEFQRRGRDARCAPTRP